MSSNTHVSRSLRTALLVDAAASGAMGVLLLAASTPLSAMLALPAGLLRGAGIILVPFAILLVWYARRVADLHRGSLRLLGWAIVVGNALWAADSVILLLTNWVSPSALGSAFVLAQAAAVVVFTWFEAAGLRGLRTAARA